MPSSFALPSDAVRHVLPVAFAFLLAFALAACDTAVGQLEATADNAETAAARGSGNGGDAAVYVARLTPLNPDENGQAVTGTATFTIEEGVFTAEVDARGLAVTDDANGDGVLDVVEGVPAYGPILVPLDEELADLSFQTLFPEAESVRGRPGYGIIDYEASTAFEALQDALNEELALDTRHVVLHGVAIDTELPGSVQTLAFPSGDPIPPQITLPVACGEIRRVR